MKKNANESERLQSHLSEYQFMGYYKRVCPNCNQLRWVEKQKHKGTGIITYVCISCLSEFEIPEKRRLVEFLK